MSWEQVSLADTKLEKPAPVPVGNYVFTLQPGSEYRVRTFTDDNGTSHSITELNVRFDVTGGDFNGRPVWVTYPDPEAISPKTQKPMTWSLQALKKLEISLGIDALPGESPAQYLNRAALSGAARVTASLLPGGTFKDKNTGVVRQEDPKFGIFTVGAAA